eukprot:scaffold845_cov199-Alexandrium_tamarense.AAC.35
MAATSHPTTAANAASGDTAKIPGIAAGWSASSKSTTNAEPCNNPDNDHIMNSSIPSSAPLRHCPIATNNSSTNTNAALNDSSILNKEQLKPSSSPQSTTSDEEEDITWEPDDHGTDLRTLFAKDMMTMTQQIDGGSESDDDSDDG